MKKNHKKFVFFFWLIIIFILTTFPMKEYNGTVETYYDKVAHFFLFGIFSFLLFAAFEKQINRTKLFFISVCSGVVYSIFIEFLQIYVPGRNASELDFFAGFSGSLIFSLIAINFVNNRKNE